MFTENIQMKRANMLSVLAGIVITSLNTILS